MEYLDEAEAKRNKYVEEALDENALVEAGAAAQAELVELLAVVREWMAKMKEMVNCGDDW